MRIRIAMSTQLSRVQLFRPLYHVLWIRHSLTLRAVLLLISGFDRPVLDDEKKIFRLRIDYSRRKATGGSIIIIIIIATFVQGSYNYVPEANHVNVLIVL